jgi:hypothetical protein
MTANAYGHEGPWPGFDQNGQVASGFAVKEGGAGPPKFSPVFYLADLMTGYFAAAGMMAALLRRSIEGGILPRQAFACEKRDVGAGTRIPIGGSASRCADQRRVCVEAEYGRFGLWATFIPCPATSLFEPRASCRCLA